MRLRQRRAKTASVQLQLSLAHFATTLSDWCARGCCTSTTPYPNYALGGVANETGVEPMSRDNVEQTADDCVAQALQQMHLAEKTSDERERYGHLMSALEWLKRATELRAPARADDNSMYSRSRR